MSGKIKWDDRGAVKFEFAAHSIAKRPAEVARTLNELILRRASFNCREWQSENSRSRVGSFVIRMKNYLRLFELKSGLLIFDAGRSSLPTEGRVLYCKVTKV